MRLSRTSGYSESAGKGDCSACAPKNGAGGGRPIRFFKRFSFPCRELPEKSDISALFRDRPGKRKARKWGKEVLQEKEQINFKTT